ncbi:MAG TPA: serine hydrolase [Puia sp.]|nr:serine hydrolase [Puia sp.]
MKQIIRLIIPFGLFIALSCHERAKTQETGQQVDPTAQELADFEHRLTQNLANKNTGSFSVAVFNKGEIIWSKAFGKADDQKGLMADTSTVYRIGSISKTITAYLMMLMVQKGVIHLDDPVARYLPEIRTLKQYGDDSSGKITFRQLADHTSGLAREPNFPTALFGPVETWEAQVLNSIPATTLTPPHGKTFSYSNIGYAILGLAISRAAHRPFISLVEALIFRPHGMKNSFYSIPRDLRDRIATGYSWNAILRTYEGGQSEKEFAGRGYRVPNGGVFTTADDLARFVISLTADADPLAKNYRDSMQTVQSSASKVQGYGFGLDIKKGANGIKMVGHGGLVAGFSSYMVFNPEYKTGVVLLRNCDDASLVLEIQGNILLNNLVRADKEAHGKN